MLELIKGFVAKVASERIVKSNAEILVLRHKNGEKSLVNSYPAASKVSSFSPFAQQLQCFHVLTFLVPIK